MRREFRTVAKLFAVLGTAMAACACAFGEEAPGFSVPLQQQPSGAFYVRGTLAASVETALLVDTGSSYVVLSRKTFAKLKGSRAATYLRSIQGATAAGRVVTAKVFELSELALGEDCVLRAVEVVVLPGSDRDILGLSALKRVEPFTFDLGSSALRFAGCAQRLGADSAVVAREGSTPTGPYPVAGGGAPW